MLTRKMVRFSAVALVGLASVLATEARAQLPNGQALTAPLFCTLTLSGATLTVQAGADGLPFPHDVTGGSCPLGQTCSEYTYRFTYTGGNLSHSFLSVSADLSIFAVSPDASIEGPTSCSGETTTKVGVNVCEQRQIRFNEAASTVNAAVIVTRSAPRVSTAGARKGSGEAFCLIQGPGAPGNVINAASVDANLLVANGHCLVNVTQASDGAFTSVALPPNSPCTITVSDTAPVINNEPVQIPPGKFVTFGTNSCSVTARRVVNGKYVTVCLVP